MINVKEQVAFISEVLSGLEGSELEVFTSCKEELQHIIKKYGNLGLLALSVIGAEYAQQAEAEDW